MTKLNTIPTIEFKTVGTFETWLEKNHDNSNISMLSDGIYFIRIVQNNKTHIMKFLKE